MATGIRRIVHFFIIFTMLLGLALPLATSVSAQDATSTPVATEQETTPTEVAPTETATTDATEVATTEEATAPPTETPTQSPTPTDTVKPTTAATAAPTEKSGPKTNAVISPTIALSKSKGVVGSSVIVTISGFPAKTVLAIRFDGTDIASVTTDSSGKATKTIKIPAAVAGAHKIVVAMSGRSRSASFTVTPRVALSPTSGAAGSTVNATLTGFGASEKVTLLFAGSKLKIVSMSSSGGWKGTFAVPSGAGAGEKRVEGSGSAGNSHATTFTVTTSATPTPTVTPGTLVVKTENESGDAIAGACYAVFKYVDGVRGASVGEACDSADGSDGTTTFNAIAAGTLLVAESKAPTGYLPAHDVKATVSANRTTTITVENEANDGLTVVKSNEFGAPLKGACFSVYTDLGGGNLGTLVTSACDDDDDLDDGLIRLADIASGNYVLVEKVVPRGYARAPKQSFSYTHGAPLGIAIQDKPGGAIVVTKVNEAGDPISGACFDAYVDLGGGAVGNFVDRGCNADGSVITIEGLPVGNYFLIESKAPVGFALADKVKFSIAAKKDAALTVADTPTTKLVIRKQDESGHPLKSSCFEVYKASSEGRGKLAVKQTCDNADGKDDGYVTIPLSPGTYVLAETKAPKGYLIGEDIQFRIKAGLDTDLDVPNVFGGIVRISTYDLFDEWIRPTDVCYTVWTAEGSNRVKLGTACDATDGSRDGVTSVGGLPTGEWFLEQSKTPWGYFEQHGFKVNVVAREVTEVDFFNEPWPTLIIHKVDENGDPLGSACFTGFTDLGGGQRGVEWFSPYGDLCDDDGDGDLYARVTPGNQILVETRSPLGYLPIADVQFAMVRGEVTELTVENFQVGLIYVHKTDLDGDPLNGACFEAYHNARGKRGALAATGCDKETGEDTYNISLDATTILNGLEPGEYWIAEKTPPKGYFAAPDVLVLVESAENEVTIEDEPWPLLTITKIDDNGDPVKGACFRLFKVKDGARGTSVGGQVCGTLNNIIKIGAEPGTYILGETKTPTGYVTAKDIQVTFVRGTDKEMEIVDLPSGFVQVQNVDEANAPLKGACWELWTDVSGKPVAKVDKECSTTVSTPAGQVTLEAAPGKYWLKQVTVPAGYKPIADRKVTVVARKTLELTIQNLPYPRFVVNSVDGANKPLPGACFDIYIDGGTVLGKKVVGDLCDKADGALDGTTTRRLEPGRYVARETTAPTNYAKAPDFKFTIEVDTDLVLTLQHQVAGVLLVTTKDRASLVLTGACFELWTKLAGGGKGVLVAKACDKEALETGSKLDGTTKLSALPPGGYLLVESYAPTGYLKAADRTVTVIGGSEVSVTVTNDKE